MYIQRLLDQLYQKHQFLVFANRDVKLRNGKITIGTATTLLLQWLALLLAWCLQQL
jgi:hypothetical protein